MMLLLHVALDGAEYPPLEQRVSLVNVRHCISKQWSV